VPDALRLGFVAILTRGENGARRACCIHAPSLHVESTKLLHSVEERGAPS
jgi:hypothetical protein